MSAQTARRRGGRRVCLVAVHPAPDPALPERISNHGLRMVEATLRAAGLADLDLLVLDLVDATAQDLADAIEDFDPDVVGFSTYIWSLPLFADVIRRLRCGDASRVIVLGGPSAQPVMLDKQPFHDLRPLVDALVTGEGERTFLEIVAATDRSPEALLRIAGVAVHGPVGWGRAAVRPLEHLDDLASPYVADLVPPGGPVVLQTYRGCPFTCAFCEWGVLESPRRVRSRSHLAAELEACARLAPRGAILVDAGLNLNEPAFAELAAAARETGFFRDRRLICEVYPARVADRHLDFLAGVGKPLIGVGLQSFDPTALATVERSFDERRFADNVAALANLGHVAIEIIVGLPGDGLRTFLATFRRARSFPCTLRVYHCVVLPSALMVRSPPEHRLEYDPLSLKMQSCLGWTTAELQEACRFLDAEADREGGRSGDFLWTFPPPAGVVPA
jgi:radical SAM superfamily enzyme YgiQ (UPF0313 family)